MNTFIYQVVVIAVDFCCCCSVILYRSTLILLYVCNILPQEVSPLVSFDQLRKENEELRRQLTETQQLMAQLLSEAPNENYGQR